MPTDDMVRSEMDVFCGMAMGKPLGLLRPRPMRSSSIERGWGDAKITMRPMPAPGWEASSGFWGTMGWRVWVTVVVVDEVCFAIRREVWLGWCEMVYSDGFLSRNGSSSSSFFLDLSDLASASESFSSYHVFVPVTISANQSPRPPGAASTAVCGL